MSPTLTNLELYGQGDRAFSRWFGLVAGAAASAHSTASPAEEECGRAHSQNPPDDEDREKASDDDPQQLDAVE
jgi:hypothetical protein